MKTPEDRLTEGLRKWEMSEKERASLILGCMLHLSVLVIAAGFGYYLGLGITALMFGSYMLLFTAYKLHSHYQKEKKTNDTSTES